MTRQHTSVTVATFCLIQNHLLVIQILDNGFLAHDGRVYNYQLATVSTHLFHYVHYNIMQVEFTTANTTCMHLRSTVLVYILLNVVDCGHLTEPKRTIYIGFPFRGCVL